MIFIFWCGRKPSDLSRNRNQHPAHQLHRWPAVVMENHRRHLRWRDVVTRRKEQHMWDEADQLHQLAKIFRRCILARVFEKDADVADPPISLGEELFVTSIVAHLSTVFRAMKHGEFVKLEGLQNDIRELFALPIPKAVWDKLRPFQDANFAKFIETALNNGYAPCLRQRCGKRASATASKMFIRESSLIHSLRFGGRREPNSSGNRLAMISARECFVP